MKKLPLHAIAEIHETLYREHVAVHDDAGGSPILAVDGSKIHLAPALAQHGFRPQRRSGESPIALLTVVYDVRRGMIASMDISSSFDERAALQRLVRRGAVPQGATLLADRGYFSRELWTELHEAGILALFRVRRNASGFVMEFLRLRYRTRVFYPWHIPTHVFRWRAADDGRLPPAAPVGTIPVEPGMLSGPGLEPAGTWDADHPPLAPPDAREDDLLLVSTAQLTHTQCVALYQLRWTVETCFRALKSDLGMGRMRCSSVHGVVHGIEAACLAHLLVRLLDAGGTAVGREREAGGVDRAVAGGEAAEEGEGPRAAAAGDQWPDAGQRLPFPAPGLGEAHGRRGLRPCRRASSSRCGTVRRPRRVRDKARFVAVSLWGRVAVGKVACHGAVARRARRDQRRPVDRPPRPGAWQRRTKVAAATAEAIAARLCTAARVLRDAVAGHCASKGPVLVAA
jgi:hypothetical protein